MFDTIKYFNFLGFQGHLSITAWDSWALYGLCDMVTIYGFFTAIGSIFVLTRDPKLLSAALTTAITRIKEKSHEIFIQLAKIDIPLKTRRKCSISSNYSVPVALSNKYTTHALDKLIKIKKLDTDQQSDKLNNIILILLP